jgi:hypothetical protein
MMGTFSPPMMQTEGPCHPGSAGFENNDLPGIACRVTERRRFEGGASGGYKPETPGDRVAGHWNICESAIFTTYPSSPRPRAGLKRFFVNSTSRACVASPVMVTIASTGKSGVSASWKRFISLRKVCNACESQSTAHSPSFLYKHRDDVAQRALPVSAQRVVFCADHSLY